MEHRDRAGGPDEVERRAAAIGSEFGQVFLHHYPVLLRQAQRRLGSRVEAEDAVQDAFERAFRGYQAVAARGDLAVGAWLSRIVSNVCCDHYARRKREEQLFRRVEGSVRPAPDVADQGVDPPLLRQLKSAVAGLPASHREAWVMRDVVGMDYPEVAEAAGISEVNARARVSRARASLQRRMHAVGVSAFAFPLALFGRMVLRRRGRLDGGVGLTSRASNVAASASSTTSSVSGLAQQYLAQVAAAPAVQQAASGLNPLRGIAVAAAGVVAVGAGGSAILSSGPSGPHQVATVSALPAPPAPTIPAGPLPGPQPSTSTAALSQVHAGWVPAGDPGSAASMSTTSTSTTSTTTTAPPRSTPPTTAESSAPPKWIGLALGQPAGMSPANPTSSTAPSPSSSGSAPDSSTTVTPTTSTTVAPAPACPWPISADVPPAPASIASDQVFSTINIPPIDLSTVGSLPGFNVGTGLQMAGTDGADIPIAMQMNACIPPVTGGIFMVLTGQNISADASGSLVGTVGDPSRPGYLFRGTVSPEGPTLPEGVTTVFVAQLSMDRTANTAQLTVAFIDESPSSSGGSAPGGSTGVQPPSATPAADPSAASTGAAPASTGA